MLIVDATRLSAVDRFRYTIERVGEGVIFSSEDQGALVAKLTALGVEKPDLYVTHVRAWGAVEIVERSTG